VFRDDYGNVVGVLFGMENGPTVLAVSHMDTVTADAPELWAHAPHSGRVENGRIFGVGAADCKGGLAAQIFAAVALKRSLLPLRGNLVVAATVAEENGASVGVRALLEETLPELGLHAEWAILGEPTNLGLYYGHEGWATLSIYLQGKDPFQVMDASRLVYQDFGQRGAAGRANNGKENFCVAEPHSSANGGESLAEIRLTRRLLYGESLSDVVSMTRYCAGESAGAAGLVGVDVELTQERQHLATGKIRTVPRVSHPWMTDPFSPIVERATHALSAAGSRARPGQFILDRLGMGTAGGTLVTELGVPTIGYGPGDEQAAHARDEYVETRNLAEAIYGNAAIAHSLVGVPVYGWSSDEI